MRPVKPNGQLLRASTKKRKRKMAGIDNLDENRTSLRFVRTGAKLCKYEDDLHRGWVKCESQLLRES